VLVLGSPIYFSWRTGVYRAFLERLAFPVCSYHYENGKPLVCRDKVIETANIFTMNCPESMMKELGYPTLLESNTQTLSTVFGLTASKRVVVVGESAAFLRHPRQKSLAYPTGVWYNMGCFQKTRKEDRA
jgi:multimeric flavodoxin WrbA